MNAANTNDDEDAFREELRASLHSDSSDEPQLTEAIRKRVSRFLSEERLQSTLSEFKNLNFREEAFPVDGDTIKSLLRSQRFWMVLAPGVLPLFFVTVQGAEHQLFGLTMFFAIFWGVAFWKFVIGGNLPLRLPLAAFLFAGIVGIPLIAWLGGETREEWYNTALTTKNAVTLFLAQLLIAGLPEELMKAIPVIAYLSFYRSQSKPFLAVLIGVFSGLGFAAFENVSYHDRFVTHAIEGYAYSDGDPAAVKHTFSMLFARTFSTVFMHALTSGIFAYFLAVASISTNRLVALPLIGYSTAFLGHTFYNTFISLQPTVALVVLILMYVVFCAELEKLREMTGDARLYPEAAKSH